MKYIVTIFTNPGNGSKYKVEVVTEHGTRVDYHFASSIWGAKRLAKQIIKRAESSAKIVREYEVDL